jgi:hypothetical protein
VTVCFCKSLPPMLWSRSRLVAETGLQRGRTCRTPATCAASLSAATFGHKHIQEVQVERTVMISEARAKLFELVDQVMERTSTGTGPNGRLVSENHLRYPVNVYL